MSDPHDSGRYFFQTILRPHRSLSPRGFNRLMALLAGLSVLSGIFFVSMGAWPVVGFFGLDVLLVYIAFRASYRSANMHERIALSETQLSVERVELSGARRNWRFEPAWVRVELNDPPEDASALRLASHDRRVVIGHFLPPETRICVAEELRAALRAWKASLISR